MPLLYSRRNSRVLEDLCTVIFPMLNSEIFIIFCNVILEISHLPKLFFDTFLHCNGNIGLHNVFVGRIIVVTKR